MGPLLPVVGVAEIQVFHTLNGRTWSIRTFWADFAHAEYTLADLEALGTAFLGAYGPDVVASMSVDVVGAGATITDLTSNTAPRHEAAFSGAGTSAGKALPLNCAAVLKWQIPRRYRGGHPHIFLAGFEEAQLTDESHWQPTFITGIEAAWANVYAACNAVSTSHSANWTQVNVSRFSGKVERNPPIVDELFVPGWVLQPRMCSRRRRLPKITA